MNATAKKLLIVTLLPGAIVALVLANQRSQDKVEVMQEDLSLGRGMGSNLMTVTDSLATAHIVDDFDVLMELIEETLEPEEWSGPSFPHPLGRADVELNQLFETDSGNAEYELLIELTQEDRVLAEKKFWFTHYLKAFQPIKRRALGLTFLSLPGGCLFGACQFSPKGENGLSVRIDLNFDETDQDYDFECEFEAEVSQTGVVELGDSQTVRWRLDPIDK